MQLYGNKKGSPKRAKKCPEGDLNPHAFALEPESSASTNSTIWASLLLQLRYDNATDIRFIFFGLSESAILLFCGSTYAAVFIARAMD